MNTISASILSFGAVLLSCILSSGCSPRSDDAPTLDLEILPVPAAGGSAEPRLVVGHTDTVVLSWLEPTPYGDSLLYTTLGAGKWDRTRTVRQGEGWFVNWADFPSVVPLSDSLWAAHWLVRKPGSPYAYDVTMSLSSDGGKTWGEKITPHDDGTATEHGFVSLFPWLTDAGTSAGILWLDGRNMISDAGGMTLRSAVITAEGRVGQPTLVDDLVCDCCQTDTAVGSSGPVAVYRNRTTDEIRDIYVTRAIDGEWESPRSVADDGWKISGCPVNGPAVAADGDLVATAWFTAAGGDQKIRVAFSTDSAASFTAPRDVAVGNVRGRVDVVLDQRGDAIVSWLESLQDGSGEDVAEIRARRVSQAQGAGKSYLIARTGEGRPSGFPQMVLAREHLIFAWTDTREEFSQVRTVRIAAAHLH